MKKQLLLFLSCFPFLFSFSPPETQKTEFQLSPITQATLTFTPTAGGAAIVATAVDPDGAGPQGLAVAQQPALSESTKYTLTIALSNASTNINDEIKAADEDYRFFFAPAETLFTGPPAYNDTDDNGLPIGLSTAWTTACTEANLAGAFRLVLKHLPGTKTAASTINDGATELDLTWNMTLQNDPQAPPCENEEEIIDKITLTFTPKAGGDPIVAVASDPDGPGPLDLELDNIVLTESAEYDLSLQLENTIEGVNITQEILAEDDEHLFFFAWTDAIFRRPDGDGNIDRRGDSVQYLDQDENGLPVGLSTRWTTECVESNLNGQFRIVLKHQPGTKTAISTVTDGGTDLDLTFNISVRNDPNAPPCENEEEIIDKVTVTFTPKAGGDPIVAVAADPDGPGPLDLELENVVLFADRAYDLTLTIENTIDGVDITQEIREEDDEHLFFFGWTNGLFQDPTGNGNIDKRSDPVNYNDSDENGLPIGLSTAWTTKPQMTSGTLRIVLKHQPGTKSATSTVADGGTDLDLTWNISTVISNTENFADLTRPALRIAPNPARELIQWRLDHRATERLTVRIFDPMGRMVFQTENPGTEIPIHALPAGTYTFQVRIGDQLWNERFVKY